MICAGGFVHSVGMSKAVGRFDPRGTLGYRAASAPSAALRATRAEAEADECRHLHLGA